jgi:Fe-S-cluster containining protein
MPDYNQIAVGATRAALSVMRSSQGAPDLIDKLVDTLHELGHAVNDQLQAEGDRLHLHLPVCAAGCGWCCHTDVLVTPPELLRIAAHLRDTRSPEELELLTARLRELAARTGDLSEDDWRREHIACPLHDGTTSSCTIYDARPAPCRAYNSLSLPKCLERYDTGNADVPGNGVQQKSILAVGIGLAAACRLHDLEWEGVSLTAGLAEILDAENPGARWLAGERLLQGAQSRTSRTAAAFRRTDVDTAIRGMKAHADELPARPPAAASAGVTAAGDDDAARRERNRKKRLRKGR